MTFVGGGQTRALVTRMAAVILAIVALEPSAAEWSSRANIAPAVTYTDNVCLTKNNKKGDWIGTLTPSGSIRAKGRNADLSLAGSVQLNSLTNSALNSKGCTGNIDDRERFSPRLTGQLNTVVIDNWMNLNITARADQNAVTTRFPGGGDDLDRRGNTNTFYRYSVAPVINRKFKDLVKLNLRYSWDQQFNTDDRLRNSQRHNVNLSLANATQSRWSRSVEGRYTQVMFDENFNGVTRDDNVLSSARVKIAYRFNRRWSMNGSYGREWNEFQTRFNRNRDGPTWATNVIWTPTSRTSVSIGTGDRFFGNTPRLDIQHRHKRSTFSLNYQKEIRFENDLRVEDLDGFDDNFLNPSILSNGPILDERLAAGWSYDAPRATIRINGNYSQQTRSEDGEESAFKNINMTISPRLSTRYNLSGAIAWNEDEPRGRINELRELEDRPSSETWHTTISLSRSFNNRFSLSLSYRFTYRLGNSEFNEYQENRVTARLGISL